MIQKRKRKDENQLKSMIMSALIHSLAPLNFKPVSKQLRICIFCIWNINIFHSLYATPWSKRWYYENHLSSLLKNFQFVSCLVRLLGMMLLMMDFLPPKIMNIIEFCMLVSALFANKDYGKCIKAIISRKIHSQPKPNAVHQTSQFRI